MKDDAEKDDCRRRAAHANPDAPKTAEQEPLPESISRTPTDQKSPAEWAYQRIILYIQNFEKQLDGDHEIAIGVTDSGAGILRIEGVGYFDPDIVTFYGTDQQGARMQLIQHVSQLSVALRAMAKPGEVPEPRRIGFKLAQELEEN